MYICNSTVNITGIIAFGVKINNATIGIKVMASERGEAGGATFKYKSPALVTYLVSNPVEYLGDRNNATQNCLLAPCGVMFLKLHCGAGDAR